MCHLISCYHSTPGIHSYYHPPPHSGSSQQSAPSCQSPTHPPTHVGCRLARQEGPLLHVVVLKHQLAGGTIQQRLNKHLCCEGPGGRQAGAGWVRRSCQVLPDSSSTTRTSSWQPDSGSSWEHPASHEARHEGSIAEITCLPWTLLLDTLKTNVALMTTIMPCVLSNPALGSYLPIIRPPPSPQAQPSNPTKHICFPFFCPSP
jgi:hypothetical protein